MVSNVSRAPNKKASVLAPWVYVALCLVQTGYSYGIARFLKVEYVSWWVYLLPAITMAITLMKLTWGHERKIKRVALASLIAVLVFVATYLLCVAAAVGFGDYDLMALQWNIVFLFLLTLDPWIAYGLCMVASALAMRKPEQIV